MFMTLEDETGVSNLVIWKTLYEKQRRVALSAHPLGVEGYIQREGGCRPSRRLQAARPGRCAVDPAGPRRRRWRPVVGSP
ncbi:hypothetical protein ACRAWD_11335 [Caulobacter segnis]